jgi:uncharacterized membrane protein YhaH (DUF805 family)
MTIFFGFSGRIGRGGWWLSRLALFIIACLIIIAGLTLHVDKKTAENNNDAAFLTVLIVGLLLLFVIDLCSTVKRYHDRNKSGWWYLIAFIPFGSIWQLIECGMLSGDEGENYYGPPPGAGRPTPGFDREIDTIRSGGMNRLDDDYMANYAKQLAEREQQAQGTSKNSTGSSLQSGGNEPPKFGKR